jgi:hypothetical protein
MRSCQRNCLASNQRLSADGIRANQRTAIASLSVPTAGIDYSHFSVSLTLVAYELISVTLWHGSVPFPTRLFPSNERTQSRTTSSRTRTRTQHAIDQHGGSLAPVEVHVPVPLKDVPRHPPLTLHNRCWPRCFSRSWEHVKPPSSWPSLPDHGQGTRCPECS